MIANQHVGIERRQTLITFNNGATWQKIAAPAASYCRLVRAQCMYMYI